MIYYGKKGQDVYGQAIGILMLPGIDKTKETLPLIPGFVGNASTFSYPVRYKTIDSINSEILLGTEIRNNKDVLCEVIKAGKELEREGVKAITADCGFMALFQNDLAKELEIPVFLSSLLQIPFIKGILKPDAKIGILCANSETLDNTLLNNAGIHDTKGLCIKGLQNKEYFNETILLESSVLDSDKLEREMVDAACEMISDDSSIKALLLECSVLPAFSAAIQEATNLPVFDYTTMIDFVYSAVVRKRYHGFL